MVDEVVCEVSQLKESGVFSCGSEVTESQREWLEPKHLSRVSTHNTSACLHTEKQIQRKHTEKTEDWLRCLKRDSYKTWNSRNQCAH